jgi:hypothetical protein
MEAEEKRTRRREKKKKKHDLIRQRRVLMEQKSKLLRKIKKLKKESKQDDSERHDQLAMDSLNDYILLFLNRDDELTASAIASDTSGSFFHVYGLLKQALSKESPLPLKYLGFMSQEVQRLDLMERSLMEMAGKVEQSYSIEEKGKRMDKIAFWTQMLDSEIERYENAR